MLDMTGPAWTWQPGQLVLNPGSDAERIFSDDDHDYFRSRAGQR